MSWNDFTERYTSGNRVSPAVTLTTQNVIAESSSISWNALTPTGTTLTIEIALSADGGTTWGAWQTCTSGQSVPGISNLSSLQNVQLKIRETLTTTNVHATPELQDLTINIFTAWPNIVYGPNKSTLTAWDAISLAWKADRLSLVVNDTEACYIENPGLPTAFGSYAYIGTDRNGANAINTLVDELRIDKVYKDVATRTAWHKAGSPFFTSEDMKQWPGYVRVESDGIKVYDADNNLRVLIGSWLKDMIRKYGEKIIGGEFYSSLIQTGEEGENRGIIKIDRKFLPEYPDYSWGNIIFNNQHGNVQMEISSEGNQPQIYFYDNGTPIGEIRVRTLLDTKDLLLRNEKGIDLRSEIGGSITIGKTNEVTSNNGIRAYSSDRVVLESPNVVAMNGKGAGSKAQVNGYEVIVQGNKIYLSGATEVTGNLRVLGTVHATGDLEADGSKPAIIPTANYGRIRQYATESPEIVLFDRGRARLENGKATVYIDPIHLECIEPDTDLTPWTFKTEVYGEGEDIRVIEWGENYFKVKESNGSESNRIFGWWFYATRKNYAGIRLMEVID